MTLLCHSVPPIRASTLDRMPRYSRAHEAPTGVLVPHDGVGGAKAADHVGHVAWGALPLDPLAPTDARRRAQQQQQQRQSGTGAVRACEWDFRRNEMEVVDKMEEEKW